MSNHGPKRNGVYLVEFKSGKVALVGHRGRKTPYHDRFSMVGLRRFASENQAVLKALKTGVTSIEYIGPFEDRESIRDAMKEVYNKDLLPTRVHV